MILEEERAGMRVCLTGGIASGKSTVARMFAELGAAIVDADQAARQAVESGTGVRQQLRELLGPGYFDPGGALDRRKLRRCIISDPACRARVNAILHPAVASAMQEEYQHWRRLQPRRPVLLDIPLLFEAHLDHLCDWVILVFVPRRLQIERLMTRDGVSREEAEASLGMQLPLEDKKERAHRVIDNSGSIDDTRAQVEGLWAELTALFADGTAHSL
jgi:dephospho-CoA kinase